MKDKHAYKIEKKDGEKIIKYSKVVSLRDIAKIFQNKITYEGIRLFIKRNNI